MKKIIFTVAAIFAFGFANAQDKKESKGTGFSKGNVFLSGVVGITSDTHGDDKSNSFGIEPKAGFFVSNNIAIGARLGYFSTKAEDVTGDTQDDGTFTAGVFGRYYFTPASNFSVYADLGFNYVSTDHKLGAGYKTDGFDVALTPGINYFVSDHFAIEANFGRLGYATQKDDTTGAESYDNFSLVLDLRSISFGLLYKL